MRKREKAEQALAAWRAVPRTWKEVRESTRLLVALRKHRWHQTLRNSLEPDLDGAVPHLTYGATDFLHAVLTPQTRILEFGSGDSTIWFGARVGSITVIEHDADWAARIPRHEHIQVNVIPCAGSWYEDDASHAYSRGADSTAPFDIVLVDGMARTQCAIRAPSLIRPGGLIVLDDIDDPLVAPARTALESAGLDAVDFWGLRPGSGKFGGTAVYGFGLASRIQAREGIVR